MGNPEGHKVTSALEEAYHNLYGTERMGNAETEAMRKARPLTDKWTFSTNGVSLWDVTESHASVWTWRRGTGSRSKRENMER